MSIQDHPKAYGAAALTFTFAAGILVTLGFKDIYPDVERRFQDSLADSRQQRKKTAALRRTRSKQSEGSAGGGLWRRPGTSSSKQPSIRQQSSAGDGTSDGVVLEDHESDLVSSDGRDGDEGDDWSMLAASSELPNAHVVTAPPVADGIAGCIGNTPLIRIKSLSDATGCDILAKAELLNPGGSPKDRVALSVIRAAEARGLLVPFRGDTIYEGTVGSTGISIATLARALGYRAHICMPNDQSLEKSQLLREMGATVQRVPVTPIVDPGHYVNLAKRLAIEHEATHNDGSKGFFSDQFETPANAEAHRRTTGPEILRQVAAYSADHRHDNSTAQHGIAHPQSPLDAFVCGAGTAGTLTGIARYLKEDAGLRASLRVVAADPQGSGLYNLVRNGVLYAATEKEGTRRRSQVDSIVEGIGMNRMTATLEAGLHLIDDAVSVTDKQACLMARWLVENEGIFAGSSSAVNCVAAVKTALTLPPGSCVVTVLCDSGLRHLSKFYKKVEELKDEAAAEPGTDLLSILGVPPRKD